MSDNILFLVPGAMTKTPVSWQRVPTTRVISPIAPTPAPAVTRSTDQSPGTGQSKNWTKSRLDEVIVKQENGKTVDKLWRKHSRASSLEF